MTKSFSFHNAKMSLEFKGHGSYILRGLNQSIYFTDSSVWDYCDDDENYKKCLEARRTAYDELKSIFNRYYP